MKHKHTLRVRMTRCYDAVVEMETDSPDPPNFLESDNHVRVHLDEIKFDEDAKDSHWRVTHIDDLYYKKEEK